VLVAGVLGGASPLLSALNSQLSDKDDGHGCAGAGEGAPVCAPGTSAKLPMRSADACASSSATVAATQYHREGLYGYTHSASPVAIVWRVYDCRHSHKGGGRCGICLKGEWCREWGSWERRRVGGAWGSPSLG